MKKYYAPQVEIIQINSNDIIATSAEVFIDEGGSTNTMYGRFSDGDFSIWDED